MARHPVRATAYLAGNIVAKSDDVRVVEGTAYFPMADVRDDSLSARRLKTLCYWKGVASYFDVIAGDVVAKRSAWTYRHPTPLARRVKGRVAFWYDVDVRIGDG